MSALIGLPKTTHVLSCSQCEGFGTYRADSLDASVWTCDTCYHDVHADDIRRSLDYGEYLTTAYLTEGEVRLAWSTRLRGCHTCGSTNDHHFSVRVVNDMPARLIPCPNESE
jgi:hypothetical protein